MDALEEGECGNGYECCTYRSYDCNCRDEETCIRTNGNVGTGSDPRKQCTTTTTCDTCQECTSDVSDEKCEVVCGTCYSPEVTLSYLDYNDVTHYLTDSDSCGRDDYSCVTDLFDDYGGEVGYTRAGWYDPFDNDDISYSAPEIKESDVIATWFFAIIMMAFLLAFLIHFIWFVICKIRKHLSCSRAKIKSKACCAKIKSKAGAKWTSLKRKIRSNSNDNDISSHDAMEMQTSGNDASGNSSFENTSTSDSYFTSTDE